MKHRFKRHALSAAVVITTIVVILLAVLQYRWSAEVSETAAVRLADTLQLSMVNWQLDLLRNLSEICLTLRLDPAEPPPDQERLAAGLAEWQRVARYPDLLAAVYSLTPGRATKVEQLYPATEKPLPPPTIAALANPSVAPPADLSVQPGKTFIGNAVRGWYFDSGIPGLVHHAGEGWILIELDPEVMRSRIFPDLAIRYFQGTDGLDYEVAVVAGPEPKRVLYTSDAGFGDHEVVDADGTLNVFGRSLSAQSRTPLRVFHAMSQNRGPEAGLTVSWFPQFRDAGEADDWRLVVRHRRGGPLGTFVADLQRRNLVVGFGALLLLVVSMGMLIAASNRAQRLARLQLDFVTAVSHELRTPLTVISSAADNIAQGVVHGREQLAQYGRAIGNQVQQLSTLVEEILSFAATSSNPQRLTLRPVRVQEIIDATLSSTDELIRAAQFTVQRDVPDDLPMVTGDLVALSQVLQNLITNGLKYSVEGHWLGIRAMLVDQGLTGREVQISLSDRGMGISSADLPHIFEPFYRSPSVSAAQIRGTGLGLTLARRTVEAMRGAITVTSEPGKGSTFTLHLPCAKDTAREGEAELTAVVRDQG